MAATDHTFGGDLRSKACRSSGLRRLRLFPARHCS